MNFKITKKRRSRCKLQQKYISSSLLFHPGHNYQIIYFVENDGADEKFKCFVLLLGSLGSPDVSWVSSKASGPSWAWNGSNVLYVSEVSVPTAAVRWGYFKLWRQFIKLHFWKMVQCESYLLHISLAAGSHSWLWDIYYHSENLLSRSVFHI